MLLIFVCLKFGIVYSSNTWFTGKCSGRCTTITHFTKGPIHKLSITAHNKWKYIAHSKRWIYNTTTNNISRINAASCNSNFIDWYIQRIKQIEEVFGRSLSIWSRYEQRMRRSCSLFNLVISRAYYSSHSHKFFIQMKKQLLMFWFVKMCFFFVFLFQQSGGLSTEAFKQALQESVNFPLRPYVLPFLKSHIPVLKRDLANLAKASNQVHTIHVFRLINNEILFVCFFSFKIYKLCIYGKISINNQFVLHVYFGFHPFSRFYNTFDQMKLAYLSLWMRQLKIHRPIFLCPAKVPRMEVNDINH